MVDTLADSLNVIKVAELNGKDRVFLKPASKMLKQILQIFKDKGYIEEFSYIDNGRGGEFSVKLSGKINDCKAVKPRFNVKFSEWEKFENRFLPAVDVGLLIVTTSKGLVTHISAKEKRLGGKLIACIY